MYFLGKSAETVFRNAHQVKDGSGVEFKGEAIGGVLRVFVNLRET
jgi:hypothetical protein